MCQGRGQGADGGRRNLLVRRTGLPKATVSRLTTTLISVGYLRRVGGGRQFELSAGALSIGHAYLEANPVTRIVNPIMQKLADKLDLSVALAIPHHVDMLYIAWRASVKIATLRLGVGSLLPMESTAVGRAYLYVRCRSLSVSRLLPCCSMPPAIRRTLSGRISTRHSTISGIPGCAWRLASTSETRTG